MAVAFVQVVATVAIINLLFRLSWPIWGPALFASVAIPATFTVAWTMERSPAWLAVGMACVGATLGLWFKSRYGGAISGPTRYWDNVTATDVFTMLSIVVASYGLAVWGTARNRRGEPPLSLGLVDWLDRTFSFSANQQMRLNTSLDAQCWYEWRRKGWAMPIATVALMLMGLVVWLFSSRDAEDLFQGFVIGGLVLSIVAFIAGLLLGNTGTNDADYRMGHFLATRPLSDADFGRAILRTLTKTVVLSWLIWLVGFVLACGGILASGGRESMRLPEGWTWISLILTVVGPWAVAGTFASLGLLNLNRAALRVVFTLVVFVFAIEFGSKFLLSHEIQNLIDHSIATCVKIGLLAIVVSVYWGAHRCRLIQTATVLAAATFWVAGSAILAAQLPAWVHWDWLTYLLIAAAMALVVSPVAAIPLALSWNRHR
jgi:hypothetical protein